MASQPEKSLGTEPSAARPSPGAPGAIRLMPGLPPPAAQDEAPEPAAQSPSPAPAREPDPYSRLIDNLGHFSTLRPGEIRQGRVVKISGADVIVDIGLKSDGLLSIEQFRDAQGQIHVQPGDLIDVMIEDPADAEGYVRLSHQRARRLRQWDRLETALEEKTLVTGLVLDRVKGGLEIDLGGVKAFLPGSQADLRPTHNVDVLKGQQIQVRVLKLNKKRGNVVVSRRLALEEEIESRKRQTLQTLVEGAVLTGAVKNLTDYGAFIDLGGIDGLLHVTDISHGRVGHPSEALHVGDPVTVKVLKFDRARERVSLGVKQLLPDPWEAVAERYPRNSRAFGRVMNVTDYGAFIELEPGVEGLIHVTEMSWSRRTKHPSKILKSGDPVEVVILEVHPKDRRISLGLKQLEPNPWTTLADRYSVGSVVQGRVRNLADFGAFVEIEDGVDGLVHVSDLSWSKHVKHPSEVLKKGQRVQAVILRIDSDNRRLSLGIKQLQPDAWETFFQSRAVGDLVRGKVTRHASFGVFAEVAPGIEGLCHSSELPDANDKGREPPPIGQFCDFRIIKLNPAEKKIGLSLRAGGDEEARARLEESNRQAAAASTSTIEEVLSLKDREEP